MTKTHFTQHATDTGLVSGSSSTEVSSPSHAASSSHRSRYDGLPARRTASPRGSTSVTSGAMSARSRTAQASDSLQLARMADDFSRARTSAEAGDAARRALSFYTRNSSRINEPLRNGTATSATHQLRQAIDHALGLLPGYGAPSGPLDRRVHFSRHMLDEILRTGTLHDPAFMSTTMNAQDPSALSLRNTLIHLQATEGAPVGGLAHHQHMDEYLLRSGSTLVLEHARMVSIEDEDDPLHDEPDAVRAELWMRQVPRGG